MGQAGPYLRRTSNGYMHWCPACEAYHAIAVDAPQANGAQWSFNGDFDKPTFSPSIKCFTVYDENDRPLPAGQERVLCHYHIKDGQIQFCKDNPHKLNGKTVPLPALEDRG